MIDVWTERDEAMHALLQRRQSAADAADPDEDDGGGARATVSKAGTSLEAMEADVRGWLAEVLGEGAPPSGGTIQEGLSDGVRLCHLARALREGACVAPSASALPFKQMENIAAYLAACPSFGVAAFDMFQTVDLFEGKGMRAVLNNLLALKRACKRAVGEGRRAKTAAAATTVTLD